jgi:predicted secreted protein
MAEKTPDEKKAKQREYAARHYRKNREAVIAASQADKARRKKANTKFTGQRRYAKAREEVKKCIVLCANCHRIHHYNEKGSRRSP